MDTQKIDNLIHQLDSIARSYDGYEYGLPTHHDHTMIEMENAIKHAFPDNVQTSTDKSEKMRAVLEKLVASFPEMDTDEPIAGSDAVDILCGMWDEIKDAIK